MNLQGSRVHQVEGLVREHVRQHGVLRDPRSISIVVPPDSAIWLMRELLVYWPEVVTATADQDELFCILGVPIRVRLNAPPGEAFVFTADKLPPRSCCDQACQITLMTTMTRGNA